MSAPKKGKDLSALKARLAKKAAAAAAPGPEAAAPDVPAPGQPSTPVVPAPGEAAKPPVAASIPAPGEVAKPADIPAPGQSLDIPAPGEVRPPAQEAPATAPAIAPARAPQQDIADDPMSGGVAFDPDAGLIADVGGDIKPRSSVGLGLFAGVMGVAIGGVLGWMGHKASDSRARMAAARSKAETIQAKVEEIENTRANIALAVGDAEDALTAKEGEKASAALAALEPTYVELGELFGWQLASMDPKVIKLIFGLAEANNSLQLDVGILKAWVGANEAILAGRAKGPSTFVVVASPEGGVMLAEYVAAICDPIPDPVPEGFKVASLKRCTGEGGATEIMKAPAYEVRMEIDGPTAVIPTGQAMFLTPAGPMYSYAIGANPDANAKAYFDLRMGKIKAVLADMAKMKDDALKGIGNYTDDPQVSGE